MTLRSHLLPLALFATALPLAAQKTTSSPATDSAAQASPIQPAPKAPADDSAAEASPLPERSTAHHTGTLAPGTAIHATLTQAIDSGALHNGQTVHAKLTQPLQTSAKVTVAAGTPVSLTVIGTVPAGKLTAVGEFSLQAIRVGGIDTFTDIKTYRGEPGHREVADAAPALGTNAGLPSGAPITFHVSKSAVAADTAPNPNGRIPGSVDGTAPGSKPTPGSNTNSGEPTYGMAPATNVPAQSQSSTTQQQHSATQQR